MENKHNIIVETFDEARNYINNLENVKVTDKISKTNAILLINETEYFNDLFSSHIYRALDINKYISKQNVASIQKINPLLFCEAGQLKALTDLDYVVNNFSIEQLQYLHTTMYHHISKENAINLSDKYKGQLNVPYYVTYSIKKEETGDISFVFAEKGTVEDQLNKRKTNVRTKSIVKYENFDFNSPLIRQYVLASYLGLSISYFYTLDKNPDDDIFEARTINGKTFYNFNKIKQALIENYTPSQFAVNNNIVHELPKEGLYAASKVINLTLERIDRHEIYKAIKNNKIGYYKIGESLRVSEQDLKEYLEHRNDDMLRFDYETFSKKDLNDYIETKTLCSLLNNHEEIDFEQKRMTKPYLHLRKNLPVYTLDKEPLSRYFKKEEVVNIFNKKVVCYIEKNSSKTEEYSYLFTWEDIENLYAIEAIEENIKIKKHLKENKTPFIQLFERTNYVPTSQMKEFNLTLHHRDTGKELDY